VVVRFWHRVLLDGELFRVSWASCWMWMMAMRVSVVKAGEAMSCSYVSWTFQVAITCNMRTTTLVSTAHSRQVENTITTQT
jgi:hypothetical protein